MNDLFRLGSHYICELSGCEKELLYDNKYIENAFLTSARENNLSIVGQGGYAFSPHGFTFYLLLAESHASIHVWPEYGYCAIDLFTCNLEMDGSDFFGALQEAFHAERLDTRLIERGCPATCVPGIGHAA